MLIFYHYDSNFIHVETMTDRNKIQHTAAYKRCHELFAKNNLKPKLMRLDNEASTMLTDYLDSEDVIHQFFPQGCHPRNSAERAIHTFVNHFVAGLSSCVNNFPLNLWDKLLPQAILPLNLMRTSRKEPKDFGLGSSPRAVRLQPNSNWSPRNQDNHPRKSRR